MQWSIHRTFHHQNTHRLIHYHPSTLTTKHHQNLTQQQLIPTLWSTIRQPQISIRMNTILYTMIHPIAILLISKIYYHFILLQDNARIIRQQNNNPQQTRYLHTPTHLLIPPPKTWYQQSSTLNQTL
jgi:hypothetical protein